MQSIPITRCLILTFFILLSACSTPQKRAEEKSSVFNKLPDNQKQMVLNSEIDEGFSEEAVYIALGHPAYVRTGQLHGEPITSWIYTRSESYTVPSYKPMVYTDGEGRTHVTEIFDPEVKSHPVPRLIIMFKDKVVIGWQDL